MPRQGRIDATGVLHHVIQRGIARGKIFRGRTDYQAFVQRLGSLLEDSKTACSAWVLMPNHMHLLLRTGRDPIGRVMQRLLTWYAGYFNRRYGRSGHVFQNRFKSIICEEQPYFLELVRYIHLNPIRAGLVRTLRELDRYEWSGHPALTGVRPCGWQDTESVLEEFARTVRRAWRAYAHFVRDGLAQGHRKEFEGGGVIRSLGGVVEYVQAGKSDKRLAGDERILGSSEFVDQVLAATEKEERRRSRLRRQGWNLARVAKRVAEETGLALSMVRGGTKTPIQCRARALMCFWSVMELGYAGAEVAGYLDITKPAVSVNARRGRELALREKLTLQDE